MEKKRKEFGEREKPRGTRAKKEGKRTKKKKKEQKHYYFGAFSNGKEKKDLTYMSNSAMETDGFTKSWRGTHFSSTGLLHVGLDM
jgi:hypothetical protein